MVEDAANAGNMVVVDPVIVLGAVEWAARGDDRSVLPAQVGDRGIARHGIDDDGAVGGDLVQRVLGLGGRRNRKGVATVESGSCRVADQAREIVEVPELEG